jgi:hypothetical protein
MKQLNMNDLLDLAPTAVSIKLDPYAIMGG